MLNLIKIEFLSIVSGFREFILTVAEKINFRTKEFKIALAENMIEKDLDLAFCQLGKKGLSYYQTRKNFNQVDLSFFENEMIEIKILKEKYSEKLEELSNLQRIALKEVLSDCMEKFNRTGWGLAQIVVPERSLFKASQIKELNLSDNVLILMVNKETGMDLAHGNTILQEGDALICIGTENGLDSLKQLLNQLKN